MMDLKELLLKRDRAESAAKQQKKDESLKEANDVRSRPELQAILECIKIVQTNSTPVIVRDVFGDLHEFLFNGGDHFCNESDRINADLDYVLRELRKYYASVRSRGIFDVDTIGAFYFDHEIFTELNYPEYEKKFSYELHKQFPTLRAVYNCLNTISMCAHGGSVATHGRITEYALNPVLIKYEFEKKRVVETIRGGP